MQVMKRFIAMMAILILSAATTVRAEPELTERDLKDIAKMEEYLNGITTMSVNFTQSTAATPTIPNTHYSYGKFLLSRPGKIRWEYTLPDPIVIVVDNNKLTYYDKELDQVTHGDVDSKITTLLTQEHISLRSDQIEVVSIRRDKVVLEITVRDKQRKEDEPVEQLTLTFTYAPVFTLRRMSVVDQNGKTTNVELTNHMYGMEINKDLFVIKNPRIFDNKKN